MTWEIAVGIFVIVSFAAVGMRYYKDLYYADDGKTYSGDTITDKFVSFATTGCGISIDTITSFRNLMLE